MVKFHPLKRRFVVRFFRWLAAVVFITIGNACLAAPGDPDTTFGSGGTVQVNLDWFSLIPVALLQQNDGKIVEVLHVTNSGGFIFAPTNGIIVRFNIDGSLDTTFGNNGIVGPEIPALANASPSTALLQPDGKLLISSGRQDPATLAFTSAELTRFNTNGTVDSGYAQEISPTIMAGVIAIFQQEDGKLLVAGITPKVFAGVFARYLANGQLDPSFGIQGIAPTFGPLPAKVALDSSGRIVTFGNGFLTRYLPNGALDLAFGTGGTVASAEFPANVGATGLSISTTGRILVTGHNHNLPYIYVARYLDNGSLDPTFGTGGVVTTMSDDNPGGGQGVSVQALPDGRTLVGGNISSLDPSLCSPFYGVLVRYKIDGSLDPTFGNGTGKAKLPGCNTSLNVMLLQADGKIVTAAQGGGRFSLTRQLGDATVDVIEFYNAGLDHYFISSLQPDIQALDSRRFPGWARTGYTFKAYPVPTAGTSPVCRFYLPPQFGDSHFYSASSSECTQVLQKYSAFVLESSSAMYIAVPDQVTGKCSAGMAPVYRLWDKRIDTNHRYTTDRAVRDQMIGLGWVLEGYGPAAPDLVIMCAPTS